MARIRQIINLLRLKLREQMHFFLLGSFRLVYRVGNAIIALGWGLVTWSVQQAVDRGAILEPIEDRNTRTVIDRFDREE